MRNCGISLQVFLFTMICSSSSRRVALAFSRSSSFTRFSRSTTSPLISARLRTYTSTSMLTMKLQTAIVGLPNVGKSTLFNALTESQGAEAANYPFCTIEPNSGIVSVPDERLEVLGKLNKSIKVVPATLEFVDVAGLIKGASTGEGLGNQFLAAIRQCDAIVHVVCPLYMYLLYSVGISSFTWVHLMYGSCISPLTCYARSLCF